MLTEAPPLALAMQRAPEVVLAEAAKAAQALRALVERKPGKLVIRGKTFLQFEDWQTLGRFYGVTTIARTTSRIEYDAVRGFECHAEALLVSTDQVISGADAMCLSDEENWRGKPLYQLRSMSQTRACAKALRNVLAWVVVLAGYAPTPAEEMQQEPSGERKPEVQCATSNGESRVQKWAASIANAPTRDELTQRFRTAYSEASAHRNREAQLTYIQAKDARLRELSCRQQ